MAQIWIDDEPAGKSMRWGARGQVLQIPPELFAELEPRLMAARRLRVRVDGDDFEFSLLGFTAALHWLTHHTIGCAA